MSMFPPGGAAGGGDGPAGGGDNGFYGPEERPTSIRGVVVVVVVLVIGILLLPSATRAPTLVAASATVPTTTAANGSSTTTTVTHGSHHGATTTTTVPAPATVHVLVANGTNANGVAGAVSTFLGQKGYGTLTATNALTRVTTTLVYPTGGSPAAAHEVATSLGLSPNSVQAVGAPAPVPSAAGATVVVIAGPELAARFHS